ncbi:hypothetical protein T11_6228 [Trichinella zimbabwensis]|uniref:Uncharacterized protein n=1 Tax=Trichinella zimbabwensis TaxID=268475 RepID=A0A0V1HSG3_9BILA|nr:hypothetical protein T11_6228 [Trichinella zimbabwensis]
MVIFQRKETMTNANLSEASVVQLKLGVAAVSAADKQIYRYKIKKYNNATEGRKNETSTIRLLFKVPEMGL